MHINEPPYLIVKKKTFNDIAFHVFLDQHMNIAQKMQDLLHWDAKLDSVRWLLFSWPHQSEKPFRSEDSKLRVAQLVERVTGMTRWHMLNYNGQYRHGDIFFYQSHKQLNNHTLCGGVYLHLLPLSWLDIGNHYCLN